MASSDQGFMPSEGAMGQVTFYKRDGKIIMRKRHNLRSDKGRTIASMTQRTKMANLSSVWRAFGGGLRGCFENKKPGATDFSGFMAMNLGATDVYLTKEQVEMACGVAAPLCVSCGTLLPCIEVEMGEEGLIQK